MNHKTINLKIHIQNHRQRLQTHLLITANNINSKVHQALKINTHQHNYHQHAIVANVQTARPHHGVAYKRFTTRGPMALLPMQDLSRLNQITLI